MKNTIILISILGLLGLGIFYFYVVSNPVPDNVLAPDTSQIATTSTQNINNDDCYDNECYAGFVAPNIREVIKVNENYLITWVCPRGREDTSIDLFISDTRYESSNITQINTLPITCSNREYMWKPSENDIGEHYLQARQTVDSASLLFSTRNVFEVKVEMIEDDNVTGFDTSTTKDEQVVVKNISESERKIKTVEDFVSICGYNLWDIVDSVDGKHVLCNGKVFNLITGEEHKNEPILNPFPESKSLTTVALSRDNERIYTRVGLYEPYRMTEEEIKEFAIKNNYGLRVYDRNTGDQELLCPYKSDCSIDVFIKAPQQAIYDNMWALQNGNTVSVLYFADSQQDYLSNEEIEQLKVLYKKELPVQSSVLFFSFDGKGLFYEIAPSSTTGQSEVGYWDFESNIVEEPTERSVPEIFKRIQEREYYSKTSG